MLIYSTTCEAEKKPKKIKWNFLTECPKEKEVSCYRKRDPELQKK
jgi:hypothetical protein